MNEQNIIDELNRLSEKDKEYSSFYLKCHNCQEVLQRTSSKTQIIYACPNDHAYVEYVNNQPHCYTLIWDADDQAKERYKLISYEHHTILELSNNGKYWRPSYKKILTLEYYLPLEVQDQTIVVGNLINRLKNLKAFS